VSDECCYACAPSEQQHNSSDQGQLAVWQVRELRAAGASGLLLAAGFLASRADVAAASTVFYALALIVGGWTFIPETLRALLRGRLGVGTPHDHRGRRRSGAR
jgi:cation-transporting P-type ATPase G